MVARCARPCSRNELGGRHPADTANGQVPNWFFVRAECIRRVPAFKSPGVRISKASWTGGRVRASGRVANNAQFGVRVTFKCGKRTRSKTVRDKRGVWA